MVRPVDLRPVGAYKDPNECSGPSVILLCLAGLVTMIVLGIIALTSNHLSHHVSHKGGIVLLVLGIILLIAPLVEKCDNKMR